MKYKKTPFMYDKLLYLKYNNIVNKNKKRWNEKW